MNSPVLSVSQASVLSIYLFLWALFCFFLCIFMWTGINQHYKLRAEFLSQTRRQLFQRHIKFDSVLRSHIYMHLFGPGKYVNIYFACVASWIIILFLNISIEARLLPGKIEPSVYNRTLLQNWGLKKFQQGQNVPIFFLLINSNSQDNEP